MFIYAHRAMVFSSDPTMMDRSRVVQVQSKSAPQEIPDWCADDETFKAAVRCHYLEIVDVPVDQHDQIAALSRRLAPSHIAPLAAETRPLRTYHPGSGLGVLAKF